MNERLHEMMMEATKDMPQGYYVPGEYFEKFAELIVRECVEVVKWTPSQFSNDEYVKNIQEHFGVEL